MSGVIKRRGDEGQRGKERWRTEEDGGGGKKKKKRDEDRKKWKQEQAQALLHQTGYCPRTFLWYKMSAPFCLKVYF